MVYIKIYHIGIHVKGQREEMAMAHQSTDIVVGEFPRKRVEVVRCSIRHVKQTRILDLRVFYRDEAGQWRPTPRGISLTEQEWPELRHVLVQLSKALKGEKGGANGA
jgi:hypothetical protein